VKNTIGGLMGIFFLLLSARGSYNFRRNDKTDRLANDQCRSQTGFPTNDYIFFVHGCYFIADWDTGIASKQ
jgi:hypothetical protein